MYPTLMHNDSFYQEPILFTTGIRENKFLMKVSMEGLKQF